MNKKFTQVELSDWPVGLYKELATFPINKEEWISKYGVKFEESYDDLGEFTAAIIISPKGTRYCLKRYHHPLQSWFTLHVMGKKGNVFQFNPGSELQEFLELFGLTKSHLSWLHPESYEIKN
jgi:hypothetical protein